MHQTKVYSLPRKVNVMPYSPDECADEEMDFFESLISAICSPDSKFISNATPLEPIAHSLEQLFVKNKLEIPLYRQSKSIREMLILAGAFNSIHPAATQNNEYCPSSLPENYSFLYIMLISL